MLAATIKPAVWAQAMRLLLIGALLMASISLAQPASASADDQHAAHHTMPIDHHDDGSDKSDNAPSLIHMCPGCALVGHRAAIVGKEIRPALPRLLATAPALNSFASNPIPPPPRLA